MTKKSTTQKNKLTTKTQQAPESDPHTQANIAALAKAKWSYMQTDLKSALGSWDTLDNDKPAKSPEEEQLDKVKTLIEDLKLKLNDF